MQKIQKYTLVATTSFILLASAGFISAQSTNATSKLDNLLQMAQQRADNAQQRLQQIRDDVQTRIKDAHQKAQEKISQIKDKSKQDTATRIQNQLDHVNQVWTDYFSNVLDRLDAVLQKIQSRADKASQNGQDVTAVTTAIQNANDKIAAARTVVANQAQNTYEVDATSISDADSAASSQSSLVSQLRDQFKSLKDQLFSD